MRLYRRSGNAIHYSLRLEVCFNLAHKPEKQHAKHQGDGDDRHDAAYDQAAIKQGMERNADNDSHGH